MLFLFFLLKDFGIEASPILSRGEAPPTPSASLSPAGSTPRTLSSIVWGCVSTSLICAWVAVHPNVPPPMNEAYGWKLLMRKFRLMFWTLVAPEVMVAWSFRQWLAAGMIADIYNNRHKKSRQRPGKWASFMAGMRCCGKTIKDWLRGKRDANNSVWTRTHGHFVVMGGVILVQPEDTGGGDTAKSTAKSTETLVNPKPLGTILNLKLLATLVKNPNFKITITQEEIADKAKGDFLSKTIAILQVSWFITQCVARLIQGLTITELEIVTLALASMNGVMYVFWLDKPLGVKVPIKIPCEHQIPSPTKVDNDGRDFTRMPSNIAESFNELQQDIDRILQNIGPLVRWFLFLTAGLLLLFFLPLIGLLALVLASLREVIFTETIPEDATHVPAFYSSETDSNNLSFFVILTLSGFVFGGIHCLGWNLEFPSQAERTIWRVASLTVTLTPPISTFSHVLGHFMDNVPRRGGRLGTAMYIITSILVVGLFALAVLPTSVFVLARLVLVVEAFASLRHQPTTAFQRVNWAKFLPHVVNA